MEQQITRILTPSDRAKIIANLNECLALFEKQQGLLTGAEIRAKSLLSVLRSEILRADSREQQ
jgi:hypothetical protein